MNRKTIWIVAVAALVVNVVTVLVFWDCARFAFVLEPILIPLAGMALMGVGLSPARSRPGGAQDFVIIGNAWDAGRDNPTSKHQVALALSAKGHRVLWVDGAGMRRPSLGSCGDRSRIISKLKSGFRSAQKVQNNIWRVSPLILPLPSSSLARAINESIYRLTTTRAIKSAGMSSPVLINFMPTIPGVISNWKGKTVYYCVDRWDQFDTYDGALMEKLDAECCQKADVVLASAEDLFERCRRHNENVHLLSHGVDWVHFARALQEREEPPPSDSGVTNEEEMEERGEKSEHSTFNIQHPTSKGEKCPTSKEEKTGNDSGHPVDPAKHSLPVSCIPHPTSGALHRIGFFGLISEWVDQELLVALAGIENCEVALAGKADVSTDSLDAVENIKLIGSVPYCELPDLVATFDVGIIPFQVNELTRAVNPIKLREMMAAGCPVVSTDLPEVKRVAAAMPAGAVTVAASNDEFVAMVKGMLDRPVEHQAICDAVKDQDWSAKVEEILRIIG